MSYKEKSIALAKKLARSKGKCDKCGTTTGKMQGSHIMSVRFAATAALLANIMCLCDRCHTGYPDSWHESPDANWKWFEAKWPGKRESLVKLSQGICRYRESDCKDIYYHLN